MSSNLPEDLKNNWQSNEVVGPADMNAIANNVNTLAQLAPVYSSNGSYYIVDNYTDNVYNLKPVTYTDGSSNQAPSQYFDGMEVVFLATTENNNSCYINVNNLGTKQIKNFKNELIQPGDISKNYIVTLRYSSFQDCFYLLTNKSQDSEGGGLSIGDIGTALYIDESKGLRRWLNGSLLAINNNTQAFLDWLKSVRSVTPTLFTDEETWQSEVTLSALGQIGKFVIDETAGTIRLPKIVNIQGLQDLSENGLKVEAGLPNITGTVRFKNNEVWPEEKGCFTKTSISGGNHGTQDSNQSMLYFDASMSNQIYGNSDTVQQEAIQYPYFIQIATGSDVVSDIKQTLTTLNPYSLFESKYTEAELSNPCWIKGGTTWTKTMFPTAYEALLVEKNSEVAVGTVVILPSGVPYTKQGISVKDITDSSKTDYDWLISDDSFVVPKTTKDRVLVKSYLMDVEGYNIYSDGWCEQWGTHETKTSSWEEQKLYIPYNSSNYLALLTLSGSAEITQDIKVGSESKNTTDTFYIRIVNGQNTYVVRWLTQGYIDINTSDWDVNAYFYIGETATNINEINTGAIMEQVGNVSGRVHLVETYKNGTSWYRVYSDGWCEQGGINNTTGARVTTTYLKPFRDTNYFITRTNINGDNADPWAANITGVLSYTTTLCTYHVDASKYCRGTIWKAEGYIA